MRMTGHFVLLPDVASKLNVSLLAYPMRNLGVVQCNLKECPAQGACNPDTAGGGSLKPINAVRNNASSRLLSKTKIILTFDNPGLMVHINSNGTVNKFDITP